MIVLTPTSYKELLEAANIKVLAYEEFGSYAGHWVAKTDRGWIIDYYGSCSGCDAIYAEFMYEDAVEKDCILKLADEYIDKLTDYETVLQEAKKCDHWDVDSAIMAQWITDNK